jgi:hypothetical protein
MARVLGPIVRQESVQFAELPAFFALNVRVLRKCWGVSRKSWWLWKRAHTGTSADWQKYRPGRKTRAALAKEIRLMAAFKSEFSQYATVRYPTQKDRRWHITIRSKKQ